MQAATRPRLQAAVSRLIAVHTEDDDFHHAVSVHQRNSRWQLGFVGPHDEGAGETVHVGGGLGRAKPSPTRG